MNVVELIEAAKEKTGTLGDLAKKLGKHQTRLSEWKKGIRKPDAAEIAAMAKIAGLPVLATTALILKDIYPESAPLWDEALGEARTPDYWERAGVLCVLCKLSRG